jgi:hypothetical protein
MTIMTKFQEELSSKPGLFKLSFHSSKLDLFLSHQLAGLPFN